jgi:hypothetical protein
MQGERNLAAGAEFGREWSFDVSKQIVQSRETPMVGV